jgi:hypothetical protein
VVQGSCGSSNLIKELEVWLMLKITYLASKKPGVQTPVLPKGKKQRVSITTYPEQF